MPSDWFLAWKEQRLGDQRARRIRAEVELVAPHYSVAPYTGVLYDTTGFDWFLIPGYRLPARFGAQTCDLLIIFPQLYPQIPPVGFYLNREVRTASGHWDEHLVGNAYDGAPQLLKQGWFWYCVQVPSSSDCSGGWAPGADVQHGDSLFTFLEIIRGCLSTDE